MATGVFKRGKCYWIWYHAAGRLIKESSGSTRYRDAQGLLRRRFREIGGWNGVDSFKDPAGKALWPGG